MKCLVTGGAGFIGSWLCTSLVKNHEVVCVDNLLTGSEENIAHLRNNKNFKFVRADITDKINEKADFIFNLASPASPVHYAKYPIETLKANSIGVMNMVELAKKNNAKLLQASTSEVYGDPKEHPQKESYWGNVNPVGPRACYDEGKRFAEAYIVSSSVRYSIIRIFNTYGPRMNKKDGRVVPNFINQALRNEPLTVFGDGGQTRSFCYVTDMVAAMEKVMFSPKTDGGVFNVGNPTEITVLELANIIKRLTKSKSKIEYREIPQDDPTKRKPDISKVKKATGWEPRVEIEDGLEKTIEYFRG